MPTKQELCSEIESLTQEYLGFMIAGVHGIKSKRKEDLLILRHNLQRAVLYKQIADEFDGDLTNQQKLWQSIANDYSAAHSFANWCRIVATELYHNHTEDRAVYEANMKFK